jgi:hypothetical protein
MDNKKAVINNLKGTISKGGDEKMINALKKRLIVVQKDKQVNK